MNLVINYHTVLSNLQKGGKPCYYCKTVNLGTKTLKECASAVAKLINMSVPFTQTASNIVLDKMIELALQGYRIETENLSIAVTPRGGCSSPNAKWDPNKNSLHLTVNLKGDLKKRLESAEFVNTTEGVTISLYSAGDEVYNTDGVIAGTTETNIKLAGDGLDFDASDDTQGVWFCDSEQTIVQKLTVTAKTNQTIDCYSPVALPIESGYIMVSSNRGEAGKGVVVAYKKVEVRG